MTAPICCNSACSQGRSCPLRQPEVSARANSIAATLIAAGLLAVVFLFALAQHMDNRGAEHLAQQIAERK